VKNYSYLPTALFALRYYASLLFVVNNKNTQEVVIPAKLVPAGLKQGAGIYTSAFRILTFYLIILSLRALIYQGVATEGRSECNE